MILSNCSFNYFSRKITPDNIEMHNLKTFQGVEKIRTDGMYRSINDSIIDDSGKVKLITPVRIAFSKKNGFYYETNGRFRNCYYNYDDIDSLYTNFVSSPCGAWSWDKKMNAKSIFTVHNDTVYAYCSKEYFIPGMIIKAYYVNYSGVIKNKDTILNFRMVPPYPEVNLKFNECFYIDTIPRTLKFFKTDIVNCPDSLSTE